MRTLFLTLSILFTVLTPHQSANGDEVPSWVTAPPLMDAQFYYAVGVGENASSLEAKAQAERNALEQIGSIAFGVEVKSASTLKIDLNGSELKSSLSTDLSAVHLKSVETINSYQEHLKEGVERVHVLRRYSKLEASRVKFRGSGALKKLNGCKVAIATPESRTQIFLDGKFIDESPSNFFISKGAREIMLKSSGYQDKIISTNCDNGENLEFSILLQKAVGALVVLTDPIDAMIEIKGRSSLQTPVENVELPPGIYLVKVSKIGFANWEKSIEIMVGKKTKIELSLVVTQAESKVIAPSESPTAIKNGLISRLNSANRDKNWREALNIYGELSDLEPREASHWYGMATSRQNLEEYQESLTPARVGFDLAPNERGYGQLCYAYYRISDTDNALKYCTAFAVEYQKSAEAQLLMGYLSEKMGSIDGAIKWYKKAQILDPKGAALEKYCLRNAGDQIVKINCFYYNK